jgi:uncharacterized membrane protein YphA (DoxX/SURF4 family)
MTSIDPAVQIILRASLALLFIAAASHKLRDPEGFRAALAGYELLPSGAIGIGAALLVAAEVAIVAALCLSSMAGIAAALLLAVYAVAIAINLWRGRRDIDCGCGGAVGRQRLSAGLVARNGLLVVAALVSTINASGRPLVWIDALTIAIGTAVVALVYAAAIGLISNASQLALLRREGQHA